MRYCCEFNQIHAFHVDHVDHVDHVGHVGHVDRGIFFIRVLFILQLLSAALVALLWSTSASGHVYGALSEGAHWKLEPSRLGCKLSQPLPSYGTAVFYRRAGETMRFYLESQRKTKFGGQAHIMSAAPAWMHTQPINSLGKVKVNNGVRPVDISHNLASLVMAELQRGRVAVIEHTGWYTQHKVEVEVNAVNFTEAYRDFSACLADLLPANFDQLERTTFLFDSGADWLRREYRARIRTISEYVGVDKSVARIFVDGHSDSAGRTGANWDMSRRRAEVVKEIMMEEGIPEEMIVLRYHGENFPVAKNNSVKNRAKNRRVTLRMEKASR